MLLNEKEDLSSKRTVCEGKGKYVGNLFKPEINSNNVQLLHL